MAEQIIPKHRHAEMAERYRSGVTLAAIGAEFGLTRQRVHQIVARASGRETPGVAAKLQKRDQACCAKWGMRLADYLTHVAEYGNSTNAASPLARYAEQRRNAKSRGIEWHFTFASWWHVWQESGKWDERARGSGYVMARYNDGDTPYSPGTVYICTQPQNMKDSFIVTPAAVRAAKRAASK